jgi:glycosyltransferase involved in cell wall biosynthesis
MPASPQTQPLRFGLDGAATVFPYPPGVERVAQEVMAGLAQSEVIECIPLIPAEDDSSRAWRHRELPKLEKRLGLDGILSFTSAFPVLGKGVRVQMIHELPWRNGETENADRQHKLWAKHGYKRAACIIVPSQHVWDDLKGFSPKAAARATVVPWAVANTFCSANPNSASSDLVPEGPYFLAVGATRAKKRLEAAIHGLAPFGKQGPMLIVTGEVSLEVEACMAMAKLFGVESRLRFLGKVSDEELAQLYRAATATLVLSGSEGFGFPALESLAAGTNVLHPPMTAQAEIVGDLGLLVVPDLADSMHKGMQQAIDEKASDQDRRTARLQRASQFTWPGTCSQIESVLQEATLSATRA